MKHREGRDEKCLNIFEDIYLCWNRGIEKGSSSRELRRIQVLFFFTILKIDESSSYEEILIRINVRVGQSVMKFWTRATRIDGFRDRFEIHRVLLYDVHAAAHFYVFILYRIVILSSTSLLQLFCNQITGLVEQSAFFDIPEGKWWNRSYRYLQV